MGRLTKKIPPDRSKIDAQDAKQLKYWMKALEASKEEILKAIEKVGNSAATVRKELSNEKLKPDDFPLQTDGTKIKKNDGTPVATTESATIASDVAERLNEDEARRRED
jgi:hypothetical protein